MFELFQKISLTIASVFAGTTVASSPANVVKQAVVTPSPISQVEMVNRSGEFSSSGQTVRYSLRMSKNGGEITGNITGSCEGPIKGSFEGGEGGKIEGKAKASCGIAFIRQNIEVNYSGKLYLKEGKADLNWIGEIPFVANSGSFILNFEPVN